eukprot:6008405-Heterocapsa_arctica.AAC.1
MSEVHRLLPLSGRLGRCGEPVRANSICAAADTRLMRADCCQCLQSTRLTATASPSLGECHFADI